MAGGRFSSCDGCFAVFLTSSGFVFIREQMYRVQRVIAAAAARNSEGTRSKIMN